MRLRRVLMNLTRSQGYFKCALLGHAAVESSGDEMLYFHSVHPREVSASVEQPYSVHVDRCSGYSRNIQGVARMLLVRRAELGC
jgi:hypothetical protein